MAMIGIDLGTTNSLVCVYREGKTTLIPNALGSVMTPSAVSLLEDGTILVGAPAAERLISHPETAASSFKSYMGTEHDFIVGSKKLKAHELSAFVLRQLKNDAEQYLGEAVEEAVISVPAYFNDNQRSATKLAARLAGLSVTRLVNEPSAAALFYHAQQLGEERKYLVIDFGGGTLDVSVVDCFENIIEIIAIAGDNHLGGDDIDQAVISYFLTANALSRANLTAREYASLLQKVQRAKKAIGVESETSLSGCFHGQNYSMQLTRALMRKICEPLFLRARTVISRAFKDSKIAPQEVSDVLLVGGSSKLPAFVAYIEEIFGNAPTVAENTDQIVAHGAGMYAGMKERTFQELIMTDVCPFSLGVGAYDSPQDRNPHMAVLIQRSRLLPASHSQYFHTLSDNQTMIRCEIFQGENFYAYENLRIGEITVCVPPGPAGTHYVKITFTYDIDGILHVAAESSGGQILSTVIMNPKLSLNDSEIAEKIKALEEIKLNAEGSDLDRLIMARLERFFVEFVGQRREYVQSLLSMFRKALSSGDMIALTKARAHINHIIPILEEQLYHDPLGGSPPLASRQKDTSDAEDPLEVFLKPKTRYLN